MTTMHHLNDDDMPTTSTQRVRLPYDLDHYDNANGLPCVRVVVRSRPGSACHREETIFSAPLASDRLATWRSEASALCRGRNLTVKERAMVLKALWRDVCSR